MEDDRKRIALIIKNEHPALHKKFEHDAFIEIDILRQQIEKDLMD